VTNETGNYSVVTVSYTVPDTFNFKYGKTYSTILTADGNGTSTNATKTIIFKDKDFCLGTANAGNLEITLEDYTLVKGFGDIDDGVYPLSEIEVEINVLNSGSYDVDRITVEWELYSTSGRKIDSGEETRFNLKDGDDKTLKFNILLDQDIDEFENDNPVLYIRAKGKIDDPDRRGVHDNEETCKYLRDTDLEIEARDDFVIVDLDTINGNEVTESYFEGPFQCGSKISIAGKVWNVGDADQDDVFVRVYSKALGINQNIDFGTVDSYKNEDLFFEFDIPEDLDEGNYRIDFEVYDENNQLYNNNQDEDSITSLTFKVEGNCKIAEPLIDVRLASGNVTAGEEVELKVTIVNQEDRDVEFSLAASDYNSWAESVSVNPVSYTLTAGGAEEFSVKIKVKEDVQGEKTFNLNVLAEGKIVTVQPIAVDVQEAEFKWSKVFENQDTRLIAIAVLNLLLIIIIVLVARRILRR
jgi:hypothetical protein